MIWSIHLHDYVQKLLIFQGWFFVSWKILGLEIAPQLVGKYHHPWGPLPLPEYHSLGLKPDFFFIFFDDAGILGWIFWVEKCCCLFWDVSELPILKQRAVVHVVNIVSYPVCFSFMCLICYPGFEKNHVVPLFIPQINFLCQQLLWVMCWEAESSWVFNKGHSTKPTQTMHHQWEIPQNYHTF